MKKYSLALLLLALLYNYCRVEPPRSTPSFYSPQTGDDLKKLVVTTISSAQKSIDISIFSLTDPEVIEAINRQAASGIEVSIHFDPKHSPALVKKLHPSVTLSPWKKSGLMHKKIVIVDDHTTLIGSANFTLSSLMTHENLIMGLKSTPFATGLKLRKNFVLPLHSQTLYTYQLPDLRALSHLLSLIERAQSSISIALFTLTHPKIISALQDAHLRGVHIDLHLDRACASRIKCAPIVPIPHSGPQLLHQKVALIDNTTLIFGSANWTGAAFTRNSDTLHILTPLTPSQHNHLPLCRQ